MVGIAGKAQETSNERRDAGPGFPIPKERSSCSHGLLCRQLHLTWVDAGLLSSGSNCDCNSQCVPPDTSLNAQVIHLFTSHVQHMVHDGIMFVHNPRQKLAVQRQSHCSIWHRGIPWHGPWAAAASGCRGSSYYA